jgi:hypothetical protein
VQRFKLRGCWENRPQLDEFVGEFDEVEAKQTVRSLEELLDLGERVLSSRWIVEDP